MALRQLHAGNNVRRFGYDSHLHMPRSRPAQQSATGVLPPPVAAAAAEQLLNSQFGLRQHVPSHVCCATGSAWSSSTRRVRKGSARQQQTFEQNSQQQPPQQEMQSPAEPEQRPIRVAADSNIQGIAKAVLHQLRHFGTAEVWATSSANHYTTITALAEAHIQLQQQQAGLEAVASLSASDQPVADDQKKGLKKLTLTVTQTDPIPQQDWEHSPADAAEGSTSQRINTNRTKRVADVMQLMLAQMSAEPTAAAVVECRGEQSVSRALKAALSLQASQGVDVVMQPSTGQVVDIVAEKRGEHRLVDGLLLRVSFRQQQ